MLERIRNLDPNLRFKAISVALALLIWYLVNSFSDPTIRMTVNNVSVEILHGEVIENQGDMYTVLDNTDEIPVVTLLARRSVIDKLESKNIIATADVRDMEPDSSVRIVLTTDKYNGSVERITGSISHVQLRVEPQETRSFDLEVETQGNPARGYILHNTDMEQNQVIVSGPRSYVEKVGRAAVSLDISGAEKSINSFPEIILYNAEGKPITSEEMKTQKLHLNISSVRVAASIYQTKTIPITCGSEVPIAYGYEMISDPAVDPPSVTVAGAASLLRDFDSIEIPAQDISSDYLWANTKKTLKIKNYLPDGVYLTDGSENKVTVYIRVREIEEQKKKEEKSGEGETVSGDSASVSGS